jgi:hypothetical protein
MGRLRRDHGIILGRQWLNLSLRHGNRLFQWWRGNGHALRRRWHHLLDRPDVLGPIGESRAIRLKSRLQQAIMVLLQYIDGSQDLLERSPIQSWLAVRAGWFSLHVGGEPRTRDADTGSTHPNSV